MEKIYKKYLNAFVNDAKVDRSNEEFIIGSIQQAYFKKDKELTQEEKKYLLAVERGDIGTVKRYLENANTSDDLNINVQDPLGRSALHIAIVYENIEIIQLLLNNQVYIVEAILISIKE